MIFSSFFPLFNSFRHTLCFTLHIDKFCVFIVIFYNFIMQKTRLFLKIRLIYVRYNTQKREKDVEV